jgi:tripartite-type tricarboxylate transporter receptor subunit TctC
MTSAHPRRLSTAVRLTGGAVLLAAAAAFAQDYPAKPIRLILGFPPGGSNDVVARIVAPKLGEYLGTQVVVENRPGANATIATEYVAKATPDGYTIMLGSSSPLAISPFTYSKLGYDTLRDFVGIAQIALTPELGAVHPSVPARSLKELVALARSQPGKLNFASSGNGGMPHLALELFKSLAKIDVLHVPYKGAGPAAVDLVGGHVEGMIIDFPALYPHVKAGKLRAIFLAAENRIGLLPDVPTSAEAGYPALIAVNWFAIMAPIKTPRPIVDRLHAGFTKTMATPEVKERLLAQGVEASMSPSPEAFAKFLRAELTKWSKVAKESGARAD